MNKEKVAPTLSGAVRVEAWWTDLLTTDSITWVAALGMASSACNSSFGYTLWCCTAFADGLLRLVCDIFKKLTSTVLQILLAIQSII